MNKESDDRQSRDVHSERFGDVQRFLRVLKGERRRTQGREAIVHDVGIFMGDECVDRSTVDFELATSPLESYIWNLSINFITYLFI